MGPSEGRFSTIFGNCEVIFAQNAGGVWGGGEAFVNTGREEMVSK